MERETDDNETECIDPEDIPEDAAVLQAGEVLVDGEMIGKVDPDEFRPSMEDLEGFEA